MNDTQEGIKVILTTHDDLLLAQELAKSLVESRHAACVNLVPNVTSVFQWEKDIQMENEILLIIKTTESKAGAVRSMLEKQHSYEVPEIIALDGDVLNQPYMEWIKDSIG